MHWKTLKQKIAYKSKWTTLREDEVIRPDGTRGIYNFIDAYPSVIVVPITNKNEVILVKVWRYTSKEYSWEFPGGRSDGENLLQAAKTELKEETGYTAKKWKRVGKAYPLNGLSNEKTIVFIAQDLSQSGKNMKKEEGITQVKQVPFEKILHKIRQGELIDGQSISAFTIVQAHLTKK